jgi:hypothetical protein
MPLASVSSMSSMNWVKKVTSRIFGGFLKGISWSNAWDDMMTIGKYHGFYIMGMSWDDNGMTITNDW